MTNANNYWLKLAFSELELLLEIAGSDLELSLELIKITLDYY